MILDQPKAALAEILHEELGRRSKGKPRWTSFRFASAWINRAGASIIQAPVRKFIVDGGEVRCTVGVDFAGTTEEGLKILLDLQGHGHGRMKSFVYKNEWTGSTFHPKLYLFTDASDALLIVGSNNLTGAGITTNVECSLAVQGKASDEPFVRAASLLAEWQSRSSRLSLIK